MSVALRDEEARFESVEAFLAWAEAQEERYELVDGVARMMTGGSANHSAISGSALAALKGRLRGGPCRVMGPDFAVVMGPGRVVYPDVSVRCEEDGDKATGKPVVVIEVLSPSTEAYDLGTKADAYRALPSLRHLVLVRQDRVLAQHFHRREAGEPFVVETLNGLSQMLELEAVGARVSLAELYEDVRFHG